MRNTLIVLGIAAATLALSPSAFAQDGVQIEQFEPLPDQHTNVLSVAKADTLGHWGWSTGLVLHFVSAPLRAISVDANNEEQGELSVLLDNQLKGEVWAGLGISDYFDLGVIVPVIFTQSGDGFEASAGSLSSVDGAALGDVRIVPRVRALPRELAGGFGIGVEGVIYIPSGDSATFNGEGFRAEPRLVVDYEHDASKFWIGVNAGYLIREKVQLLNIVWDDVIRLSAATAIPLGVDGLQLLGSVFGSVQTADSVSATTGQAVDDFRASPWEAQGAIRYTAPFGLHASLGGGSGLNNAVGSPSYRIMATIGFLPLDDDLDDDGIVDADDQCPEKPEDMDAWQDDDGCPDLDNDEDGLADLEDACMNDPEDVDGWKDDDGCPEDDDDWDGDGILDVADACPMEEEDFDGFEDEEGCPDPDNDQDTVLDEVDQCPLVAEDLDTFEDSDGCPDPDNDQDKILDVDDKCPLEPEKYNGVRDDDGCPDEKLVVITPTKIEILDKVYFATNKAKIKSVSFPILDTVAKVLNENPQIELVRIEGHTDDKGKDKYNMKLSRDRAEAVFNYLVEAGVDPARLSFEGYGEEKPIDSNETKDGRANNRRVEFTILQLGGKKLETEY